MESNAMVVNLASYPKLMLEFLILFGMIQLKFVGLYIAHLLLNIISLFIGRAYPHA